MDQFEQDFADRLDELGKQLVALRQSIGFLEHEDADMRRVIQSAVIQDFKLAFELAWKTGQAYMKIQGDIAKGSRDVIALLDKHKIITDPRGYYTMIDGRNLLTHTYSPRFASEVVSDIQASYLPKLELIYDFFKGKAGESGIA